jgi:hypothetical protein
VFVAVIFAIVLYVRADTQTSSCPGVKSKHERQLVASISTTPTVYLMTTNACVFLFLAPSSTEGEKQASMALVASLINIARVTRTARLCAPLPSHTVT